MEKIRIRFKPTYIPRIMPIGGIAILLLLLLPQLVERRPDGRTTVEVEPPLALKVYATGHAKTDSLLNTALRYFSTKNYSEASRILSKVQFYWSVGIREGRLKSYPEDLRFYLGLAHFYRGHPNLAAPFLQEEEKNNPFEEKYPWYLGHIYIAERRYDKARAELEKVVKLEGTFAAEARKTLAELPKDSVAP